VIHPIPARRGALLLDALQGFDEDFIQALEAERDAPAPMQDRDAL